MYNLFYFPFAYLIFELFMMHILDKFINEKSFPNIYKKGMHH